MKSRPILFSAPMVRALLDGRKTQTRRMVNGAVEDVTRGTWHSPARLVHRNTCQRAYCENVDDGELACGGYELTAAGVACRSPYGANGDQLWVRETWGRVCDDDHDCDDAPDDHHVEYRADLSPGCTDLPGGWPADEGKFPWRPSIHMPRWANRITLEVTGVRVERLQEISEADALAEGVGVLSYGGAEDIWRSDSGDTRDPRKAYSDLWESINGDGSWAANPWVWVVEFRRVK